MGLVYKLVSSHEAMPYVGKTIQTPNDRFSEHKAHYKAWLIGKGHYESSYELAKHDDCIMIVLESNVPDELLSIRENYWWELNSPCINKQVPNRTRAERYKDNRDKILEYIKQYYQDNKEKISNYKSEKIACECGCKVRRNDIARHRNTIKHKHFMDNQTLILSYASEIF